MVRRKAVPPVQQQLDTPPSLDGDLQYIRQGSRGPSPLQMTDWLLDDIDWAAADVDFPLFGGFGGPHISELAVPLSPKLPMELPLPSDRMLELTATDTDFRALSSLNVELHQLCDMLSRYTGEMNFWTFVCFDPLIFDGFGLIKSVMRTSQQFLVRIRQLRGKVYPDTTPRIAAAQTASGHMLLTFDTEHNEVTHDNRDPIPAIPPVAKPLDSPTAFIVISCFVQLVRLQEFIFSLMKKSFDHPVTGHPGYREVRIADVEILDNPLQGLLFTELVLHVLNQTMMVMGMPSPWSAKNGRTGLCAEHKYRDLLNRELGEVEEGWSSRPRKLVELARSIKSLISEATMIMA